MWAVRRTPRSQWYGSYGADSGPLHRGPAKSASRPIEASTDAISYGSNTSTPDRRRGTEAGISKDPERSPRW